MTQEAATPDVAEAAPRKSRRVNAKLLIGAGILGGMLVLAVGSALFYDVTNARALSAPPELPPMWVEGGSSAHPLGTESLGRDLLALTIAGVPTSLWVGFLAASISTSIAIFLGFWAGLKGGLVDDIIRSLSDAALTIPTFAVLVVFASSMENLSVTNMAILLSVFGWAWPTRTIRSQVLTMRERGYVRMARLDGRSPPAIMFGEIMPNLFPYLTASFIGSVSGSILAATSLEALGLGPTRIPSLGAVLDSALDASAILRGLYWWWGPPVVVLVFIFLSLFLVAVGLDEIVNPRLVKRRAKPGLIEPPDAVSSIPRIEVRRNGADSSAGDNRRPVLAVSDLHIQYELDQQLVKAVNGVSLAVGRGEALGLAGESGCGKSTVAMSALALVPSPGRVVKGEVLLNGADVTQLKGSELRSVRWSQVSLIPQGAMNSLNPVMRVGAQVSEMLVTREGMSRRSVKARVDELLGLVGLPQRVASVFPHELSGGMKQRASIAMAVALNPDLIVADEPTSALDVVTQRLVMQTLIDVKEEFGCSLLMAGHDIALLAQVADSLAVMRAGVIVEMAETGEVLRNPLHPYTQLLINSVPALHSERAGRSARAEEAVEDPVMAAVTALDGGSAPTGSDIGEHPLREVSPGHFAALPVADV